MSLGIQNVLSLCNLGVGIIDSILVTRMILKCQEELRNRNCKKKLNTSLGRIMLLVIISLIPIVNLTWFFMLVLFNLDGTIKRIIDDNYNVTHTRDFSHELVTPYRNIIQ